MKWSEEVRQVIPVLELNGDLERFLSDEDGAIFEFACRCASRVQTCPAPFFLSTTEATFSKKFFDECYSDVLAAALQFILYPNRKGGEERTNDPGAAIGKNGGYVWLSSPPYN